MIEEHHDNDDDRCLYENPRTMLASCQEILDENKEVIRDQDYILFCDYLKRLYFHFEDDELRSRSFASLLRDVRYVHSQQEGDNIRFLFRTLQILVFFYACLVIFLMMYVITPDERARRCEQFLFRHHHHKTLGEEPVNDVHSHISV